MSRWKSVSWRFGLALRLSEEAFPSAVEHTRGGVSVREVPQVEPDAAVVLDIHHLVELVDVLRFAVGCQAHDLPLGVVDTEAEVGGDGAEEQPDGVREADFLEEVELVTSADAPAGGGPLAHAVGGDDGGLLEG